MRTLRLVAGIGCSLLAARCGRPAPGPRPAATASAPAADAALAESDEGCVSAAPTPLLDAPAYRDHRFVRGPNNGADEGATLAGGSKVRIEHTGCADAKGWRVALSVRGEEHGEDRVAWGRAATRWLAGLKTTPGGAGVVSRLGDLIARFVTAGAGPVARCLDGSEAGDDGCRFESGGGFDFAVRREAGGVVVLDVSLYHTL